MSLQVLQRNTPDSYRDSPGGLIAPTGTLPKAILRPVVELKACSMLDVPRIHSWSWVWQPQRQWPWLDSLENSGWKPFRLTYCKLSLYVQPRIQQHTHTHTRTHTHTLTVTLHWLEESWGNVRFVWKVGLTAETWREQKESHFLLQRQAAEKLTEAEALPA